MIGERDFLWSGFLEKNCKQFFFICVFLGLSSRSIVASDFGTTGLIDIPTARMSLDGGLTLTSAHQARTRSYSITYQATPWLEGTFRYTGFNDNKYTYDRNYEVKLRLLNESNFLPQISIGLRDLVGTGLWGSEYLVASKKINNFDITLGLGWGRLAGEGHMKNPLRYLSDSFDERASNFGLGGQLATGTFFSGADVGFFGGLKYQFESVPAAIMLEYNPDQYTFETALGGRAPASPISAAIQWDVSSGTSLKISRQHDQEWGIELSTLLDTKSLPKRPSRKFFRSSLDLTPSDLPLSIKPNSWYDTLLYDAERSGLLLLEGTVDESKNIITIAMANVDYPIWIDALGLMTKLVDLHAPKSVKTFNILIEEHGHRVHSITISRPSLNAIKNEQILSREIRVGRPRPLGFIQHKTDFFQKKIFFDMNIGTRVQLFDPDDPARFQIYTKIGVNATLPRGWVLRGAIDRDIKNNFDESTRVSDSVIQKVRSDVVKYLKEGATGIDSLFFEKRGNFDEDKFFRVFGGILESMYSGIGAEFLYQPFQSRVAIGASASWVRQRSYEKNFEHLDYNTKIAFISAYWALPFYNVDVALHTGRYLAKDIGATLEVRRTFDNGWMVGVWATTTDVSAEDFGEGSFDKGLFFKIPLHSLLGVNTRSNYTTRVRPVQRDGGQYLEDFMGSLWWDLRSARYDAFYQNKSRLLP